jgi:hypothetical protein
VWTWRFWQSFGRGGWGVVARPDFSLHVMVGGDGGVVGPKELVTFQNMCFQISDITKHVI